MQRARTGRGPTVKRLLLTIAVAAPLLGCTTSSRYLRATTSTAPAQRQTIEQAEKDRGACEFAAAKTRDRHRVGEPNALGAGVAIVNPAAGLGVTVVGGVASGLMQASAERQAAQAQGKTVTQMKDDEMVVAYVSCMRARGYDVDFPERLAKDVPTRAIDKTGRPYWCRGSAPEFFSYRWADGVCSRIVNGDILPDPAGAIARDPGPPPPPPAEESPR